VSVAWDFPSDEQINASDILIFFQKGTWNDDRAKKLDVYLARGGGAVYIHWAVNGDDRVADFSTRIGLASKGGSIGYRHGPLSLEMHNTDHPIVRNIDQLKLYDESYWRLTGDVKNVTLFATSAEEGSATPQVWAYEKGAGRVFVSIPGHYSCL
jgi:type 1 glutamine amidotransferase